jgi:glycine cleavage system protein P-like pyridoxal-binding family
MINKIKAKLKSLFKIKRYYIISYFYINEEGKTGYGQISWVTINNKYINKITFEKWLKNKYRFDNIIILNMLHLTKSQYKFWNLDE